MKIYFIIDVQSIITFFINFIKLKTILGRREYFHFVSRDAELSVKIFLSISIFLYGLQSEKPSSWSKLSWQFFRWYGRQFWAHWSFGLEDNLIARPIMTSQHKDAGTATIIWTKCHYAGGEVSSESWLGFVSSESCSRLAAGSCNICLSGPVPIT